MVRRMASRSADPRCTGNDPNAVNSLPMGLIFHIESLPMNPSRRLVLAAMIGVSTFDRCTGASTNAPVAGTFSAPSTLSRQNSLQNTTSTVRTNR